MSEGPESGAVGAVGAAPATERALEQAAREGRVGGGVSSLRSHAARGALINGIYLVSLNLLVVLKGLIGAGFLGPDEFAIWGLLNLVLMSVAWLREVAIHDKFIQQSGDDLDREFRRAFTLLLVFMTGCTALMIGLLFGFSALYDLPELIGPGLLMSTIMLATALQFPAIAFYRRMDFVRQRLTQGVEPLVGFVISIVLLIAGVDYWALVIGAVAGAWSASLVAVLVTPHRFGIEWDRETLGNYFSFAWPVAAGLGSTVLIVQATYFATDRTLGLTELGIVVLAGRIATITHKADAVLTQTLYPAICAIRDRSDLLLESFLKSNRLTLLWGVPFALGFALFAADLTELALGGDWPQGTTYFQLVALAGALHHIGFNWDAYFRAQGQTKPLAGAAMIGLFGFFVLPLPMLLAFGLDAFGWAMIGFAAITMLVRIQFVRRLLPGFRLLPHVVRAFSPATLAAGAILLWRELADLERTIGLACAELGVFVVLTVAATALIERRLLTEAVGYMRGRRKLLGEAETGTA